MHSRKTISTRNSLSVNNINFCKVGNMSYISFAGNSSDSLPPASDTALLKLYELFSKSGRYLKVEMCFYYFIPNLEKVKTFL